jgi:hypothetical protein
MFEHYSIKKIRTIIHIGTLFVALTTSAYAQANETKQKVFEMRTYHTYAGKLPELQARFRDHTHSIFQRLGMKVDAYWVPIHEPEASNTLIYIIEHDSEETAKQKWQRFMEDPQWIKAYQASIAQGKLVESIDVVFMQKADFSQDL